MPCDYLYIVAALGQRRNRELVFAQCSQQPRTERRFSVFLRQCRRRESNHSHVGNGGIVLLAALFELVEDVCKLILTLLRQFVHVFDKDSSAIGETKLSSPV